MSGFEPLIPLAWGALRLTASLVTAGFKKLVCVEDESEALLEWSGFVVEKARDKSRQTRQKGWGAAPRTRDRHGEETQRGLATLGSDFRSGLGAMGTAVMAEATGIRADVREVKRDLASVRESVEDCRAENMEFFASFTADLEATQQGIEIMRSAPLEEAEMSLKNFEASKGKVRFLETAHSKAMTALVQGHTLDVKLTATVIAVSTGYVHMSKVDCPSEAKDFTVNGTLANVIKHFAPTWCDPSRASTADGKKTVSFLLNIVACVHALPPENVPVLSNLDKRLLPAFGALCSAEPELRRMYPKVAGAAVGAMLEQQSMRDLFHLADMVGVDVECCTSKDAVLQALMSSGKDLVPSGATSDVECCTSKDAVLQATLSSGKDLLPSGATSDVECCTSKDAVLQATLSSGKDLLPSGATSDVNSCTSKDAVVQAPLSSGKDLLPSGATSDVESCTSKDAVVQAPLSSGKGLLPSAATSDVDSCPRKGSVVQAPLSSGEGLLPSGETSGQAVAKSNPPVPTHAYPVKAVPTPVRDARTDCIALMELFSNTNGPSWKNSRAWGTSHLLGEWHGVTVNAEHRVIELDLERNNLRGPIPSALAELTALQKLNLGSNQLSGPIPSALGGLTALQELSLHQNQLSEAIPPDLGKLTALTWLSLHINHLTGPIPSALGGMTALQKLYLYQNKLTGAIPPEMGGLTALTVLNLRGNRLTGLIPRELGQLKALENAWFFGNNLSGDKADAKWLLPSNCTVLW